MGETAAELGLPGGNGHAELMLKLSFRITG
jgi:hypothetical protein